MVKEIENLSEESLEVFESSVSAVSKKDYVLAEKIATKISEIIEKEKKQMDKIKDSPNSSILKFILGSKKRGILNG